MSYSRHLLGIKLRSSSNKLPAARIIALVFLIIILVGTLLLSLPIASRSGESCGFMTALFTATSATCVTGLVLADTWVQWSGFGQVVILAMIQIGGLGFMSIASILAFSLRRKLGMKQRMLLAQAMSLNDMQGVVRLQKHVLVGAFSMEGLGAIILFFRFLPEFGPWNALKWGVFHSISAFCNAGFDILGALEPGSSMMRFGTDPVVLLTLMALIILGGLGFFVWEDLWQALRSRSLKGLSVYTKLVLCCTGLLLVGGTVLICALEWNNPATLGSMTTGEKLLAGTFQSVTTRTAGFAAIDQNAMAESTKAVSIVLMLIGGSSGSTAGGVKTVTVAVLFLAALSSARGRSHVRAFKRTVSDRQVRDAMSLAVMVLALCFLGAIVLTADSNIPFLSALYETASALATVGLTANATALLHNLSRCLIILFMYFGRVGILTISLGFLMGDRAEERFHYAETKLLIG
ncbi:MAG: TrkH family potassium uptake protein [Faecousia sp.]